MFVGMSSYRDFLHFAPRKMISHTLLRVSRSGWKSLTWGLNFDAATCVICRRLRSIRPVFPPKPPKRKRKARAVCLDFITFHRRHHPTPTRTFHLIFTIRYFNSVNIINWNWRRALNSMLVCSQNKYFVNTVRFYLRLVPTTYLNCSILNASPASKAFINFRQVH